MQQQQDIIQERYKRITTMLDANIHALQKSKRHQRSRRGLFVDAWIKCATLPPDWDSEEDIEAKRWAGLDDIHAKDNDASDDSSSTSTDVGERAFIFSRGLRHVSRLLSGEKALGVTKKRKHMRRVSERDLSLTYTDPPIIPEPAKLMAPSRRSRPSAVNIDSDAPTGPADDIATPPPTTGAKKKRIYKRRPPGAAPRPTGPGSRGGKIRGAGARAAAAAASAKREGDVGVPVDEFLAAGGGGSPGLERSESRDDRGEDTLMDVDEGDGEEDETRIGDVGEQEIDDVDRELLGEAAGDDLDEGEGERQGQEEQRNGNAAHGEVAVDLSRKLDNGGVLKKALVGYADESEEEYSDVGDDGRNGGAMSDSDRG